MSDEPFLVRASAGTVYVVEDEVRRVVRSGLLGAALELSLGSARDVTEVELARWPEGSPVDVLQTGKAPPFVVIGGKRRPLRGLPDQHRVAPADLEAIPPGPQLDVAAANVSVLRYRQALALRGDRSDALVRRGARFARRVARRLRRELGRVKR